MLRMHVRHERSALARRALPASRLYGPYHHADRTYYQWMARGRRSSRTSCRARSLVPSSTPTRAGSPRCASATALHRASGRGGDAGALADLGRSTAAARSARGCSSCCADPTRRRPRDPARRSTSTSPTRSRAGARRVRDARDRRPRPAPGSRARARRALPTPVALVEADAQRVPRRAARRGLANARRRDAPRSGPRLGATTSSRPRARAARGAVEYAAPLLRLGGALVAWKGPPRRRRGAPTGAAAADASGWSARSVRAVQPYAGRRAPHLHVFRKVAPTPAGYPAPRRDGRKRPLRALD